MANFIKENGTIPYTPPSVAVSAGDVLLVGAKICVSKQDIAVGDLGTLDTVGTYDFPKTDATVYPIGAKVYWDVADQEATEDDDTATNKLIGYVSEAALSGDALVRCVLVDDID